MLLLMSPLRSLKNCSEADIPVRKAPADPQISAHAIKFSILRPASQPAPQAGPFPAAHSHAVLFGRFREFLAADGVFVLAEMNTASWRYAASRLRNRRPPYNIDSWSASLISATSAW
jgi:hypothetical protein